MLAPFAHGAGRCSSAGSAAAIHKDRCFRIEDPTRPSLRAFSLAHGDLRAALERSRRLSSSQARCSCISASSSRARSSGEFIGRSFLRSAARRRRRVRFLERAREHFEVALQAVEEPRHRSHLARMRPCASQPAARSRAPSDEQAHHDRRAPERAGAAAARWPAARCPPRSAKNIAAPATTLQLQALAERVDLGLQRDAGRVGTRFQHAQQMQRQFTRRPRLIVLGLLALRVVAGIHHSRRVDLVMSSVTTPPNKAASATACQGFVRT